MKNVPIKMSLSKSTPGTHVYACSAEDRPTAPITSVYVVKSAFKGEPPKEITLTLSIPE